MLDIKSAADACEKAIAELGAKKYSFSTVEGETREFNVDGGKSRFSVRCSTMPSASRFTGTAEKEAR